MNTYYVAGIPFNGDNSLQHYGVKGQKWGERRYQNEDGSYTNAGRIRYGIAGLRDSIGQRASQFGKSVSGLYGRGKEFLTGSNARQRMTYSPNTLRITAQTLNANNRVEYGRQRAQDRKASINRLQAETKQLARQRTGANWKANDAKRKENSEQIKSLRRDNRQELNNVRTSERSRNSASQHQALLSAQNKRAYNATLPGKIDNFTQSAAKVIDENYNEVVDWLEENAEKAKKSAKKATSVIKEAGSKTISDLKNTASKASKNVANFFTKLFG